MVNETSTTTSNNADSTVTKDISATANTPLTESTVSYQANATTMVMANDLTALENRLQTKIDAAAKTGGSSTGLLWLVVVVALAAGAYSGYTAFQNQQKLNSLETNYQAAQSKIDLATIKIEEKASLLETTQAQNAQFIQRIERLQDKSNELTDSVNKLGANQEALAQSQAFVQNQVNQYADRNPDDWKVAESFFLVNNANQKAVYEKNIPAALWLLQNADDLLSQVVAQDNDIIALREAISKDRTLLQNLDSVDMVGLGLSLDRAYDNVDQLVLKGYSDPALRAEAFNSNSKPTGEISDWKNNLLQSAQDFSSRFIEIRRRDVNAATEFLTPAQDIYLRENIKTRILLAKNNLAHGESEALQSNLNEAIKLITAYFEAESSINVATIDALKKLVDAKITIDTPEVLSSSPLFANYVRENLSGR